METSRRLLIYSHDSFGLGHLRRCRAIAHHLVDSYKNLSVLILSGSPIIGSFDFKARVDFVRVPGVIKLRNGEYTPLQLHIDVDKTLEMRSSIIEHTADIFDPHMCIIDKEPTGLRGEVRTTLTMLKERGTRMVLGLRDVMDDPANLEHEWTRKQVYPVLYHLYDEIWVYGLPDLFDPVHEIAGFEGLGDKTSFTGYLERFAPEGPLGPNDFEMPDDPFVLVTTGGGGDGDQLIDWVLKAYERSPSLGMRAVILFGPFMHLDKRVDFQARVANLERVCALTFSAHVEPLFRQAAAVVSMGGYNTFCEILSFDKPALVVPRTEPRREQLIRAERAQKLGLLHMLHPSDASDPTVMADRLEALQDLPKPNPSVRRRLLGGLPAIEDLARPWLAADGEPPRLRANA